jgi:Domain of unknown function (DUF5753)
MGRQAILRRFQGPTLSVIIDEMVLHRPVGDPGVMNIQLHHLRNMAARPRIDLRVVPFKAGAYAGLQGSAFILEFTDQPPLVHLEVRGATGLLEDPSVVRRANSPGENSTPWPCHRRPPPGSLPTSPAT